MGYVIQQKGLFPHMTVSDNISIILQLQKRSTAFIAGRTAELMQMIGLDAELLHRYPAQLSRGQLQRVGVARALSTDPEIVLMDEPFSALDPITRADLQDNLVSLQAQLQKKIVFVTHDMSEALKIADLVCMMDQGQSIQFDTVENILKNPSNDFVSQFVGRNRIWESPEYIKVADVMINQPVTCYPNMSPVECRDRMCSHDVDSLLVIEKVPVNYWGFCRPAISRGR